MDYDDSVELARALIGALLVLGLICLALCV